MTPDDWNRCRQLATTACVPWRRCRRDDLDDLEAVAAAAIWEAGVDLDDALLVAIGRRRATDWWRTWTHSKSTRGITFVPLHDSDGQLWCEPPVWDPCDPLVELGWDQELADLAEFFVRGGTRTELAAALGVSPSRVSQLLRPLKRRAAASR